MRPVASVVIGMLAVAAAFGCSSSTGSAAPADPGTFSAIYPLLFPPATNARCNNCHGLPANNVTNGSLSMGTDKATAYAALTGKTSTSSHCGGRSLVVPGQPEASLFFLKLAESAPCGSRMPLGGNLLSDEQHEMVRSWIAAGAKDD